MLMDDFKHLKYIFSCIYQNFSFVSLIYFVSINPIILSRQRHLTIKEKLASSERIVGSLSQGNCGCHPRLRVLDPVL